MKKNIPEFLINKIYEQYNKQEADLILNGLIQEKKSTFRVNKIKSNIEEISQILQKNNIEFVQDELNKDAFIVEKNFEDIIKKLDIYIEGKIYFQSLSSMLPVIILDPKENENILDMCSAPRWKNNPNCKYDK